MGNLRKLFVNIANSLGNSYNNEMVEISWRGEYKRINNKEEIINNRETNLYV